MTAASAFIDIKSGQSKIFKRTPVLILEQILAANKQIVISVDRPETAVDDVEVFVAEVVRYLQRYVNIIN